MLERKSRLTVHERASKYGWLAAVVSKRREELGLTQLDLSLIAECSSRTIHAIETGKSTVRMDSVLAVLNVLGLGLMVTGDRSDQVQPAPRFKDQGLA